MTPSDLRDEMAQSHQNSTCEEWRFSSGMSHKHRLTSLLKNGHGVDYDVTFLIGEEKQEVKAHQLILKLHSPVFGRILAEAKEVNAIPIQDAQVDEFSLFLEFLYYGQFWNNKLNAIGLLKYAIDYQVADLEEWCCIALSDCVTLESVVKIYEVAVKYNKDIIGGKALKFILKNANVLLGSESFLEFSLKSLCKILASDSLEAKDELQVFQAVLRWGKYQCCRQELEPSGSSLRNVLENVIPLIRFPVINRNDFSLIVAPSEILNDKELITILLYLNVDDSKRSNMPLGPFNSSAREWAKEMPVPIFVFEDNTNQEVKSSEKAFIPSFNITEPEFPKLAQNGETRNSKPTPLFVFGSKKPVDVLTRFNFDSSDSRKKQKPPMKF